MAGAWKREAATIGGGECRFAIGIGVSGCGVEGWDCETAWQGCLIKCVRQECPASVSGHKIQGFSKECPYKSALQECPHKSVFYKSVIQESPTSVSRKSVPQESILQEGPTRVSNNVWPFVFQCMSVHSGS